MHNLFMLDAEARHRHSEHERRVREAADAALVGGATTSRLPSLCLVLAQARIALTVRPPGLAGLPKRLSLGVDRARS